eukprot:COSAG06_NODE_19555_length_833_cov_0.708447_1_plen_110_part_00
MIVLPNQRFQIAWEGVDPAEVDVSTVNAFGDAGLYGGVAGTVGSAPTDDERTVVTAFEFSFFYEVGNQLNFFRAGFNHVLMICWVVAHIAGTILFLETTHAVHKIGSAG